MTPGGLQNLRSQREGEGGGRGTVPALLGVTAGTGSLLPARPVEQAPGLGPRRGSGDVTEVSLGCRCPTQTARCCYWRVTPEIGLISQLVSFYG